MYAVILVSILLVATATVLAQESESPEYPIAMGAVWGEVQENIVLMVKFDRDTLGGIFDVIEKVGGTAVGEVGDVYFEGFSQICVISPSKKLKPLESVKLVEATVDVIPKLSI